MKTTMSQGETVSHTPGPWHIGKTIATGQEDIQLSGLTGDGQKKYDCFVVAPAYTVAGVGGIGKEECHANARLIAAAPDLLEACKMLIEQTAAGDWGCPPVLKARAAIAKAEGNEKEGAK